MGKIVVIGSSNVDITARMERLPRPGETIGGASLVEANGGKGANQAVASARLGAKTLFVTAVGNDSHGLMLKKEFESDGIDTSYMKFVEDVPTGVALIFVDSRAENCIAVAPGANGHLLPEDIVSLRDVIADADYLLIQLEIPIETVKTALSLAKELGVKTVLNPAPAVPLSEDILRGLYLITPNETETEKLTGIPVNSVDDAEKAALALQSFGVGNVVITLGKTGSYVCFSGVERTLVTAPDVEAVDTTAAGDVYNGALVCGLSEGMSPLEACRFATRAASLSVTRPGAQASIPYRSEI